MSAARPFGDANVRVDFGPRRIRSPFEGIGDTEEALARRAHDAVDHLAGVALEDIARRARELAKEHTIEVARELERVALVGEASVRWLASEASKPSRVRLPSRGATPPVDVDLEPSPPAGAFTRAGAAVAQLRARALAASLVAESTRGKSETATSVFDGLDTARRAWAVFVFADAIDRIEPFAPDVPRRKQRTDELRQRFRVWLDLLVAGAPTKGGR